MNWYRLLLAESHSYSTVMLEISGDLRTLIESEIDSLDDDDIADSGKEDNPHVTVLYGLHTEDPDEVKELLKDVKPFEIELGKISKFTTSDEHDVLKISVEGKELRNLNSLCKKLPYTSNYPKYQPHVTLAYVKKGEYDDMVGSSIFEGKKFKVNELVFSSKNESKTKIPLRK